MRHILILAVSDLARARAFYTAAFGWSVRVEAPVYVELQLSEVSSLGLYVRDGFARNTGAPLAEVPEGATSPAELYWQCEDLEGQVSRLLEAGARPLSEQAPRGWGDEAAYFADPDGHVIAVARPLPEGRSGHG